MMGNVDIVERNIGVELVRDDLDEIPQFDYPAGHSIRWYVRNDEALWISIWKASEKYLEIDEKVFKSEFGSDSEYLGDRQFYLIDTTGQAIGTSTAWFDGDKSNRDTGRVHWVAVIPEKQGNGLSKPIMTITCRRLRDLGYRNAILGTSTGRISAINLYLGFGFRPNIRNQEDLTTWHELSPHLRNPIQIAEQEK